MVAFLSKDFKTKEEIESSFYLST